MRRSAWGSGRRRGRDGDAPSINSNTGFGTIGSLVSSSIEVRSSLYLLISMRTRTGKEKGWKSVCVTYFSIG